MLAITIFVVVAGCVKDLDVTPIDPITDTPDKVFQSLEDYTSALSKVYASFAISGQQGAGGGLPDIEGIDEGFGNYLRNWWNHQELTTDEAIMAWDDQTIKNFHWHTWAPNDNFIKAMYSRIIYSVSVANEFIRNSGNPMGNLSASDLEELKVYQYEARFLRALAYYHGLDMFGNITFITEADAPGAFFPPQISREELFSYIEGELLAIENELLPPATTPYAAASQGAAWMLLAKLYLNAEVYINEPKYNEALTYINKVISAGYTLDNNYMQLFAADNHTSNEIIYAMAFDGLNTQQYGGMTFLVHATHGSNMPVYGHDGGWGGIRTMSELPALFGINESFLVDPTNDTIAISNPLPINGDIRGSMFWHTDFVMFDSITPNLDTIRAKANLWTWEINNVATFTHGVGVTKFRNLTVDGGAAPNAHPTFASTDFPLFRLADAYLMYAECAVRGAVGSNIGTALGYVNELRTRAGAPSVSSLDLDFILEERSRELFWEGHRRTDLIRFNQFTENGIWTWKGNIKEGRTTEKWRNLFPIPTDDLNSNPNLEQNDGYIN